MIDPKLFCVSFLLALFTVFVTKYFLMRDDLKELSDELTFYKEQYELLKSEQKQDHFDDNDLDNGGVPDAR